MVETVSMTEKQERTWGMLCHLGALSGYIIPLGSILVPLVIWLVKKDQSSFVNEHGKESVNFQISCLIYAIVAGVLMLALIGMVLLPVVLIFNVVLTIVAGLKANDGHSYHYPFTIRFIK